MLGHCEQASRNEIWSGLFDSTPTLVLKGLLSRKYLGSSHRIPCSLFLLESILCRARRHGRRARSEGASCCAFMAPEVVIAQAQPFLVFRRLAFLAVRARGSSFQGLLGCNRAVRATGFLSLGAAGSSGLCGEDDDVAQAAVGQSALRECVHRQ